MTKSGWDCGLLIFRFFNKAYRSQLVLQPKHMPNIQWANMKLFLSFILTMGTNMTFNFVGSSTNCTVIRPWLSMYRLNHLRKERRVTDYTYIIFIVIFQFPMLHNDLNL